MRVNWLLHTQVGLAAAILASPCLATDPVNPPIDVHVRTVEYRESCSNLIQARIEAYNKNASVYYKVHIEAPYESGTMAQCIDGTQCVGQWNSVPDITLAPCGQANGCITANFGVPAVFPGCCLKCDSNACVKLRSYFKAWVTAYSLNGVRWTAVSHQDGELCGANNGGCLNWDACDGPFPVPGECPMDGAHSCMDPTPDE